MEHGSTQQGVPPALAGTWQQTSTLLALRALINEVVHSNHLVARRAGMSVSELVTLAHLSQDRVGPAEIARRLGLTTAATTGIVDKLEQRGYVERHPHPGDRRRTELVISPTGRRRMVELMLPMFTALDDVDAALDEGEREVVQRYLLGALEAYRELRDPVD
ncbi:MAG: MarR family winged helix-turn-helix transcriptional regulator [Nocardioides sp.]|uniref:MarR family winged helix-turn-helix transcriptional regulator n=1 Tax=Nocardioides sp. TaxID=35761 RepID=UPI003F090A0E